MPKSRSSTPPCPTMTSCSASTTPTTSRRSIAPRSSPRTQTSPGAWAPRTTRRSSGCTRSAPVLRPVPWTWPAPDGTGHVQGTGRNTGADLVHPDERRVVLGAQAPGLVCVLGLVRGAMDRRNIVGVVDAEQDVIVGHGGVDDLDIGIVEQTEGGAQPGGEIQSHRIHGVLRPEVVTRETLVPNNARLCWHDGTLPAGRLCGRPGDASNPQGGPVAKNRLYEDDVLVIGLGRFGAEAALELRRLGHKVVAIEKDPHLAETFSSQLDRVILGDSCEPQVIEACRASTFKLAVIGIDSSIEASVLTAGNLIDAGISSIWAKALSIEHARILERIGVHHIVRPESDAGRRVAHLLNGKLEDYIAFDDGFAIVKMPPPRETIGFTLAQSQIRTKYGVTVVGLKAPGEDFTHAVPDTKVTAQHTLIVSGPSDLIELLVSRP